MMSRSLLLRLAASWGSLLGLLLGATPPAAGGAAHSALYTPSGAPFKTIELGNPTTTRAAFPTDPWNLRVIEDGARYYEIEGTAWPTGDESLANFTAKYSFSVGPAVKAADLKTTVAIPFDGDENMQSWEIEESRFGVTPTSSKSIAAAI